MKQLSKRDEQLLLILIVIGIVMAIYFLMIIPFKQNLEEAKLRQELAQDEYEDLINANDRPEVFKDNLDKLIEVKEQKEALIPEEINSLDFLKKKVNIQDRFNVKCDIVEGHKKGNAYANKMVVSYRCSYSQLESLINYICNEPQKTGVDNIKFTIDKNNTLVGTMDIFYYSKNKSKE